MNATMTQSTTWIDLCALEDLPVLGARRYLEGPEPIAVFRNKENEVFALADRCPHKGGLLSQGIVFGKKVACPLHNWTIDLSTACADAPDSGCTTSYAVEIRSGRVFLCTQAEK
jgi:nitrite reductase (NADH) small subunit